MNYKNLKTIEKCRVCGSNKLTPILSLGEMYVSNFFDKPDNSKGICAPLELVLCNANDGGCSLLQLKHTVDCEDMYRNYWYRSGINKSMTDELNHIVNHCESVVPLKAGDYVIDIGANDGTLLRSYKNKSIKTIGYEPAINLKQYNQEGTTKIISDFFNHAAWQKEFGNTEKAKVITAIGMFYDLDDPNTFVADIVKCLDDDGVFVIQMMYLPMALEKNAFDGICHEHLEYYSLSSLEFLLKRHGLEIFDVEMRENVNEGSLRTLIRKAGKGLNLNVTVEGTKRLNDLRAKEKSMGLNDKPVYDALVNRVMDAKNKSVELIRKEVAAGKKVHGYAASTKGNTTLQFYGLGPKDITAIADRNPVKFGTYAAGTLIPVISEAESRAEKPDYYFVLAWHFLPEFLEREKDYLKAGGKFIVPMPEFKVIGV